MDTALNPQFYDDLLKSARSLISPDAPPLSNLSNISALLRFSVPEINWSGFYFLHHGKLALGPFCGLPACILIPMGKGVCGTAALQDRMITVPDVHQFPGHIACDSQSRSEIVVPLHRNGRVIGVLDIDSPVTERFGPMEEHFFAALASHLETVIDFHAFQVTLN